MNERRNSPGQRTFHALANTLMGLLLIVIVGAVLFVGSCISAFADEPDLVPDNACEGMPDGREILRKPARNNGTHVITIPCVNGKIHGTAVTQYADGVIARGGLSRTPYVDGKKHGTQVTRVGGLFPEPAKIETPWDNGNKHGTEIRRYGNDQLMSQIPYVDGEKHGKELRWTNGCCNLKYTESNTNREISWENGKKHGKEIRWWYSGRRPRVASDEIPWVNGEKHGTETRRRGVFPGTEISTDIWENGVLVDFTRP